MRLKRLQVRDFLSLKDVALDFGADPLAVIVGPNGSGKSNVVRALSVLRNALSRVTATENDAPLFSLESLRGEPLEIRAHVELDADWELALMRTFMQAVLVTQASKEGLVTNVGQEIAWLENHVTVATLKPLFEGTLVLRTSQDEPRAFDLFYEFNIEGAPFTVILDHYSQVRGAIVYTDSSSVTSTGNERAIQVLRQGGSIVERSEFVLGQILRSENGATFLELEGPYHRPVPRSVSTFRDQMDSQPFDDQRRYDLADVWRVILENSLAIIDDSRSQPQRMFPVDELVGPPPDQLADVSQLGLFLFRLKNRGGAAKARLAAINDFLAEFAGWRVDAYLGEAGHSPAASRDTPVKVVVGRDGVEIDLHLAGGGVTELLVLACHLIEAERRVVVMDEPGRNLHPSMQRRLMSFIKASGAQAILVTHSPDLVPADANGVASIYRFEFRHGRTHAHEFSGVDSVPERFYNVDLASTSHIRQLLFSAGVILVEGDTELGSLTHWFDEAAAREGTETLLERNIAMTVVGGSPGFPRFVKFLDAFGIPWAAVCDGHALRERGLKTLFVEPGNPDDFDTVKAAARTSGILTLARSWQDSIEATLEAAIGSTRYREIERQHRSKVMAGLAVARSVECPEDVVELFRELVGRIDS